MGRIVCRVVACVPPWTVDPTCTTAVAVDNSTAEQNEPCWTPGAAHAAVHSPATTARSSAWPRASTATATRC